MTRTFRFSALALATLALTACGGGGGSGATASSPSDPVSVAPTPTPTPVTTRSAQTVKLAGLSIKARDTLVQTTSATTVASLMFKASSMFVGNALAATNTINPGVNFGFTSKVDASGNLVGLSVKLKPVDGSALACSDATAEVKIDRTYKVATAKDHVIALLTYPSLINADCSVGGWSQGTFVVAVGDTINAAANVTDLTLDADAVARIIPAGDQAFNTSPNALAVYGSGRIREIAIDGTTGVTTVSDLTPSTLPVRSNYDGTFAYDGTNLLAFPKDRNDAAFIFAKGKTGFQMFTINPADTTTVSSGYPSNAMIDETGTFVWFEMTGAVRQLDLATTTYKTWIPMYTKEFWGTGTRPDGSQYPVYQVLDAAGNPSKGVPTLYDVRGRFDQTMMDDRCNVWNYKTGELNRMMQPDAPHANQRDLSHGPIYSRLTSDGLGICVGPSANIFSRINVASGKIDYFNTDTLGIFNSPSRKFEIYQDRVVLLEAVSTATADVKIIEMNFDTGAVTDHGTVQSADRKVVSLVPMGN